ncbi:MAG: hypothetical protein KC503_46045 [Myxococcales bacterium]|nr:hypothetical protein [Myxococcales bacterium]
MSGDALYLNADCDATLGQHEVDAATRRRARLLTLHALIGCGHDDVALVEARPADEFCDYLESLGLGRPRWLELPDVAEDLRFCPLGYNPAAHALAERHARAEPRCALDVSRRVNARSFGSELERRLFGADVHVVRDLAQLERALAALGTDAVLKLERSAGGQGLHRVRGVGAATGLDDATRAFAERALRRDGVLVVEPWRERIVDFAVLFDVARDGATRVVSMHQTSQTRDGGLIGAMLGAPPEIAAEERSETEAASARVGAALAAEGYFGPVVIDAFVYREASGARRLRPLVEINARRPMSMAAARLRARCFGEQVLSWRFVGRKRLRVAPEQRTVHGLARALGELAYDPARRRGVLLGAPLHAELDGERVALAKLGVCIVADDAPAARALEVEMRRRVGG